MAGVGDIHRVLGEDHRIVVGEGDALAACLTAAVAIIRRCLVRRRSMSRDLLMSQFWQNLQARLQPAVPKESTELPG
jgi:hypothetical protein